MSIPTRRFKIILNKSLRLHLSAAFSVPFQQFAQKQIILIVSNSYSFNVQTHTHTHTHIFSLCGYYHVEACCSTDANSITICARFFHPTLLFLPEKSRIKTCRATRKHVDQSVRRIKREFDLRSETARNAIAGREGGKGERDGKKKIENTPFLRNSRSLRIRQSVSQALTSANICIRKSRPNICLRAGSNICSLESFSRFLELFLSPVYNNSVRQ